MIGELCALLTACCWSGSSILFAAASVRVGSILVNVARLLLAAVMLLLTILVVGISLHATSSQVALLSVSGIVGLVFGDSFLFKSYEYLGPRLSMLVMSLAPAVSALLAYVLLGEVLSLWGIFGMFVTLAGIIVVVMDRPESVRSVRSLTPLGLLYAFLGAVGQGAGLIPAKMALLEGNLNGMSATLIRIVAALILLGPLAALSGRLREPLLNLKNDPKALWLTSLGAVLGPYLGITLSIVAIEYATVAVAATIMATVPIMMLPLVRIVYKESPSWRAVSGAVIAVGGVAILFLRAG